MVCCEAYIRLLEQWGLEGQRGERGNLRAELADPGELFELADKRVELAEIALRILLALLLVRQEHPGVLRLLLALRVHLVELSAVGIRGCRLADSRAHHIWRRGWRSGWR